MTDLLVVGLSYRTAPVAVRERLAVPPDRLVQELRELLERVHISEGLLVSTCNRVEIYGVAPDPSEASKTARTYLAERMPGEPMESYLYERWGSDSVRHAFRVTSSLDSMVVGEPQILGQVKAAFEAAHTAGGVGTLLGRCFTRAFAVAKRVRSETDIAQGSVSVSSIAGDLARKIFGELTGRRVLLVGAGKMGEAAARNLAQSGARLTVVNRSPERAKQLAAACGGEARGYELLAQELGHADVVISSTGSDRFVITAELMRDVARARKHRPLFVIDIAVPRDVDPRVGEMDNVFLYDVDDLQQIAQENLGARKRAAEAAEKLVLDEVSQFERWYRSLELTPTIVALRTHFREVVQAELERTMPRLSSLGEAERRALDKMCNAMVNKLLHAPLSRLREGTTEVDGARLIDAARHLFALEEGEGAGQEESIEERAVAELAPAGNRQGEGT